MNAPILDTLLPALTRLDALLTQAVATAQMVYGASTTQNGFGPAAEQFRGLYINNDEVARLLSHPPAESWLYGNGAPEAASDRLHGTPDSRLAWLQDSYQLSPFEMDLILLALAPELDRRYERLYAYLQDHVSRRWPTVDLALNLLCASAVSRLERRRHFDPTAPLIEHGLLRLVLAPDQVPHSLLSYSLKLDEQITRFLLHQDELDERLAGCCQVVGTAVPLNELPLDETQRQTLSHLLQYTAEKKRPLRLYFHGPHGVGKRQTAVAFAAEMGTNLLVVDLAKARTAAAGFAQIITLALRYARFYNAIPYLDHLDALRHNDALSLYEHLLATLVRQPGLIILAGAMPWTAVTDHPLGIVTLPFGLPNFAQRRAWWQAKLAQTEITLTASDYDTLTGRFRLTPSQIAEAIASTTAQTSSPTLVDLFTAARAQSGHELAALAHKITPGYTWDDIILPADALAQLREMCQRVAYRYEVLGEWGFGRKLSLGKGVNALFAGPSGTGKTMAAEIIANELGLDLYKIDLSGVVSKYIGETEKNLDRIFRAAENANAILFFDEADALFGKRSEVRDSHDRYANIEISYLLQKMEEYDGLAILATNLRQNLDEAFTRRLAFTVHFPSPDEPSRLAIWQAIWPEATPLAADVALDFLARQFKLAGGNIKNVALAAAFLAVAEDTPVMMSHLLQAVRREYQKSGKDLLETELQSLWQKDGQTNVNA